MFEGIKIPTIELPYSELIKEYDEERTCEKHGKYLAHIMQFSDGYENVIGCPACADEQKRASENFEKQIEEIENEQNNILRCKELNIKPEYYSKNLEDYIPQTEGQKRAKEAVKKLIETGKGKVIILGGNGVGKTMLSSIAVKNLGGRIYRQYDIATMIRQSYTPKAEKSELEIVKELSELPFLAIDEIGRVTNSEAVKNWFSAILDERHSSGLPFMLTGNLHFRKACKENGCPKCFENYFDNDILSRLRQNTSIIVLKSNDERDDKTLSYFSD